MAKKTLKQTEQIILEFMDAYPDMFIEIMVGNEYTGDDTTSLPTYAMSCTVRVMSEKLSVRFESFSHDSPLNECVATCMSRLQDVYNKVNPFVEEK